MLRHVITWGWLGLIYISILSDPMSVHGDEIWFSAQSNSINVHWTDNSNSHDYKCKYRRKDSGDSWSVIDDISGLNGSSYTPGLFLFGLELNGLDSCTEYEIKIKRKGSWKYFLKGTATTLGCDDEDDKPEVDSNPQIPSLIFGAHYWSGDSTAPGLFRADTDGVITNYLYDNGFETRTTWGYSATESFVRSRDGSDIYGISPLGIVFQMRQEDGVLVYWQLDSPEPIVQGSLVWANDSWSGNGTAPGIYGVDANNKIVNFRWIDGEWEVRTTAWGGNAVPGSLVTDREGDTVYGVNSDGKVFVVRQESGELVYWLIDNAPSDIVPGSLVWSNDSWSGNSSAPGLYCVDVDNKVINIRWTQKGWSFRTTPWGNAVPGSLVARDDGDAVFGVSLDNKMFIVRQEDNSLVYWPIRDEISVAPNSLVWSSNVSGNNSAQGLFAVDLDDKLVNVYWEDGDWQAFTTWGSFIPGTLIRDDDGSTVYGIATDGTTRLVREEDGVLVNWNLDQ